MKRLQKITSGGQISLPAAIRHRWGTRAVTLEDRGDSVLIRPQPDDAITAARGALRGRVPASDLLRADAREDDAHAEARPR